jgi:hypothetical protein
MTEGYLGFVDTREGRFQADSLNWSLRMGSTLTLVWKLYVHERLSH